MTAIAPLTPEQKAVRDALFLLGQVEVNVNGVPREVQEDDAGFFAGLVASVAELRAAIKETDRCTEKQRRRIDKLLHAARRRVLGKDA